MLIDVCAIEHPDGTTGLCAVPFGALDEGDNISTDWDKGIVTKVRSIHDDGYEYSFWAKGVQFEKAITKVIPIPPIEEEEPDGEEETEF